mmetsp:Transcript_56997/g.112515  ORF Transcript_56997/g.112515 Transcript_56997/m.112515 type:complete len:340 (-) Transcript_56997:765-1784(-)
MVSMPGAFTVSPPTPAAMDKESLPPSMPTPSSNKASRSASHASHMRAPSPLSLAAHIQFPLHFTSSKCVKLAHIRLVSVSATVIRAIAVLDTRPLMGCSPHAVAMPCLVKWLCAMTATLDRGSCSGPTHCCCAIKPVTLRSTLCTSQRLEATEGSRSTLSNAARTVRPWGSRSGARPLALWCAKSERLLTNTLGGKLPSTSSRGKSTGVATPPGVGSVCCAESTTTTLPSPVTSPTTLTGQFSRFANALKCASSFGCSSRALFSWYSAPQISHTLRVGSPQSMARMSYRAPCSSTISLSTFPFPPHPWSWIETMGLCGPSSMHARSSRFMRFSISASPR